MSETHWTQRLFVENAELYLPFLEQARDRVEGEVSALAGLLDRYGVPTGARVLDVACGIGRHAVPLAQRGYRVTGVDLSPLFVRKAIEYASRSAVEARFVVGDLRDVVTLMADEAPFDVVLNMFTSHWYYGRDDDLETFRQLRGLASAGGVLVVLTANRDWLVRNFEPEGMVKAGPFRVLQRRSMDLETSTLRNDREFYERRNESLKLRLKLEMEHRVYSLHELRELLEDAGWRYRLGLGRAVESPELAPLTWDSKVMWVVAGAR